MHFEKIRARITSQKLDILEQSRRFVDERLALERNRGRVVETRTASMLGLLGVRKRQILPTWIHHAVHGIISSKY